MKKQQPQRIKDLTSRSSQGVLLLNQSSLQEIYQNSGPAAIGNEFQVHYWALVFRHAASDGSFLDVAVPTVFYNYPQEVTAAHIDFEMKDVCKMSTKLKPVHNVQVTRLLKGGAQKAIETIFGLDFEPLSVNFGNIHRHPGGSARQSFSGTDLDKNPKEHGIVYPFKNGNNTPSFASIMAIDGTECNLAHSEYRIVNGELGKDITYVENRSLALANKTIERSIIELALREIPENAVAIRSKDALLTEDHITALSELLTTLPSAMTNFVLPKNVVKKSYSYGTFHNFKKPNTYKVDSIRAVRLSKLELYKKTRAELLIILGEIDSFFVATDEDYSLYTKIELVESILEGYEEVDAELADLEISKTKKQEELLELGARKDLLLEASDDQLEKWYSEAFPSTIT